MEGGLADEDATANPDDSVRIFGKFNSMFPSLADVFDDEEDFMAYLTGFGILTLAAAVVLSRYLRLKIAESS